MLNELNRITRDMLALHGCRTEPLNWGGAVVEHARAASDRARAAGAGPASPKRAKARFLASLALVAGRGRA